MSDTTFDYIFGPDETLADVARRYETHVDDILRETQAMSGPEYEWANSSGYYSPNDGDHAAIPIPRRQNNLPGLSEWQACAVAEVLALNDQGQSYAVGPPLSTLLANLQNANLPIGALIRGATASPIWDYYRNARVRRNSIKAGSPSDADSAQVLSTETLFVPVVLPTRQSVSAAPSHPSAPATGATVDVGHDTFDDLMTKLHIVEAALDDLDNIRNTAIAYAQLAQVVCRDMNDLLKSMQARSIQLHRDATTTHLTDQTEASRNAALAALDQVVTKATATLFATGHNAGPSNATATPSSSASNSVVDAYCPQVLTQLSGAMLTLTTQFACDPDMMNLIVTLVPDQFARPVRARCGTRSICIDYICGLAARLAVALANSPNDGDWASLEPLFQPHTTTKAGSGCKTLLEYALACTRGFENGNLVTSPMPWECWAVAATLYMASPLPRIGVDTDATLKDLFQTAVANVAGSFKGLVSAIDTRVLLPTPTDPPRDFHERIAEQLKALQVVDARMIPGSIGVKVANTTLKAAGLSASDAGRFLLAVDKPFTSEASPFFLDIPKGMLDFFSILGLLQDFAGFFATSPSSKQKTSVDDDALHGMLAAVAKDTLGVVTSVKKVNVLWQFARKAPLFCESASLLVWCGKASWWLTVALWGYDAMQDLRTQRDVWSQLGDAAILESVLFLVAAEVGGGAICVTIGLGLLAIGLATRNRSLLFDLFKGETVQMYEAIMEAPHSPHVDFSKRLKFNSDLEAFRALFHKEDFSADTTFLSGITTTATLGGMQN